MVLTPKEVHDTPSYTLAMLNSGQWPLEGEYIPDSVYARLEQSHEELRQQLAEAQEWAEREQANAEILRSRGDRLELERDQAQAEAVRLWEKAQALHDAVDDFNSGSISQASGRNYCLVCHADNYDGTGIVHKPVCVLDAIRALLATTSPAVEEKE